MSTEKVLKLRLEEQGGEVGRKSSWLKPELFCSACDRAEHRKKLLRREGPDHDVLAIQGSLHFIR